MRRMVGSTRLLVSCAWIAAGSTILTILVVVSDLHDDVDIQLSDVIVSSAERRQSSHLLFHRYPYKPLERKPQGHEDETDVSYYNEDVSDKYSSVVRSSEDQLYQSSGEMRRNASGHRYPIKVIRVAEKTVIVEDKIFWSKHLENLLPDGLTDYALNEFRRKVMNSRVKSVHAAKWNLCGRPKNQFITLDDNSTACARYRHPQDNLVYGEILSFYLSRLLGLDNVPAVSLSRLDSQSVQWQGQNFSAADWKDGQIVAMIQWIDDLSHTRSRVRMPTLLLSAYESGHPLTYQTNQLYNATADQLTAIVQWTDMIVFDYVIGHYDRVASMQDGAEQESNPLIMHDSIRNLRRAWPTGKLWLLDNECGLLDAYTLLYGQNAGITGERFLRYHQRILQSLCIFRRQTVDRVRWLASKSRPDQILLHVVENADPLYRHFTNVSDFELFRRFFRIRLKDILMWVDHCSVL
jgi:four-jointed box protein 1